MATTSAVDTRCWNMCRTCKCKVVCSVDDCVGVHEGTCRTCQTVTAWWTAVQCHPDELETDNEA